MLRISQLKLHIDHSEEQLKKKLIRELRIRPEELQGFEIRRQSVDARKKPELYFVYSVDVKVKKEAEVLKKRLKNVQKVQEISYQIPCLEKETPKKRPIVVGSGPAGLFCTWLLASAGCRPILLERGACVEERQKDVEKFWRTGVLNPASNVQFGEGGAGTFSDGKLNTLVKDTKGRNRFVLETFVKFGAPKEILYEQKPHIGTDILISVVRNMRLAICETGGEVRFHRQVKEVFVDKEHKAVTGVRVNESEILETDTLIFAVGHSARDTFEMLYEKGIPMEAKSFAVGVRAEHPQKMINVSQYGCEEHPKLSAAPYKVTAKLENNRGVYSFCMCPGGYVVNASSEEGRLAVNGMSYHDRVGENANSAIIVTVTPDDFESRHPLAGMQFQRKLEERAFQAGGGKIPIQRYEDFCKDQMSTAFGAVQPQMKGDFTFGDVRGIFPEILAESIEEGIRKFDQKIQGFADGDTLLSGVESRTSSPVKMPRNEKLESEIQGFYPCGEGAGFAGGITSAAMDGMKVAEAVIQKYNEKRS